MKKLLGMLLIGVLIVVGCSEESIEPEFLDVKLTVNPEKADLQDKVTFKAEVTYGGKPVKDADEVKFEVWRSKSEHHEKVVVEHTEDGIYKLDKSFAEEGTYYIYAHVTAEGMHSMPKEEFVIGEPSEPETNDSSGKDKMNMEEHQDDKKEDHSKQ